ncbi:MAG: twin-arginine translocation signal domain-containing protein [Nitrospinae bacterium]|nr:twin-arginine translocation signal domain-containing protein [Nitrospinota bacterium]
MPRQQSLLTRREFIASTALTAGGLAFSPFVAAQSPKFAGTLRVAFESDITGGDPYRPL